MTHIRLQPSATPLPRSPKESTPRTGQGAFQGKEVGQPGSVPQVRPQADGFEAKGAKAVKATEPALQPSTSLSAASTPQAALMSSSASGLQQQIDAAAQSKGWKTTAPVMQQTTLDNCGPAAVAMLTRSAGSFGEQHLGDEELIRRIGSGYLNRTGPGGVQVNDMGFMMNNAGLVIDSAASPKGEEVEGYINERLMSGQKMLALLDGHTLAGQQGAGVSPHWVVIDGVDDNGQFVVKDPALGKALSVDGATLRASLESSERATGSSGLLAVEPKNQFGVDRSHGLINGAAGVGANPMGNGNGGGSRVSSSPGSREST